MKNIRHQHKKLMVADKAASLDARYFVIASNKKNMLGWKNPLAEKIPSDNWFYCWMTRLLLERVTDYVYHHSIKKYGEPKKLLIGFSTSGRLSYSQMNAYYSWLKTKSQGLGHFLPLGDLRWEVMDRELLFDSPHKSKAGLQLADIVAYSFYKSFNTNSKGVCDTSLALALKDRMAHSLGKNNNLKYGFSLKLMPNMVKANLTNEQKKIFISYGHPKQWWEPELAKKFNNNNRY